MKNEKKKNKIIIAAAIFFAAAFALWTLLVSFVGKAPIGPMNSEVGFAYFNGFFHRLIGVNMTLYTLTDLLGLVPIFTALFFAGLGAWQLIRRRSLFLVDRSLLALGIFYIAVIGVYVLFELITVNYRPVLIEGRLEGSYPSSTTMLVMSVMPTAAKELRGRIKTPVLRYIAISAVWGFLAFMVIGRIVSGVHWMSDIIGGALISAGLVLAYCAFAEKTGTR